MQGKVSCVTSQNQWKYHSLVSVSVGLQIYQNNEFHNITLSSLVEVLVLTSAVWGKTTLISSGQTYKWAWQVHTG